MGANENISPPIIIWGIATGIAVLSIHRGFPQLDVLRNYSLIDISEPNSLWDIGIAVIGGFIFLSHYIVSNKVGGTIRVAFIFGSTTSIIIAQIINPTFTLIQRVGHVIGGMVGTLASIALVN